LLGQTFLDRATRIQGRLHAQLRHNQRIAWDIRDKLDKWLDARSSGATRSRSVRLASGPRLKLRVSSW
jgi:hypothetical protein